MWKSVAAAAASSALVVRRESQAAASSVALIAKRRSMSSRVPDPTIRQSAMIAWFGPPSWFQLVMVLFQIPCTWAAVIWLMKLMFEDDATWKTMASPPIFHAHRLSDSAALLNGRDEAVKYWRGARKVRRPSSPLPDPVAFRSREQPLFLGSFCQLGLAAMMAGKTVVEPSSWTVQLAARVTLTTERANRDDRIVAAASVAVRDRTVRFRCFIVA